MQSNLLVSTTRHA